MSIAFSLNGRNVYPNYSDGISLQSKRQTGERFRRTELSERLLFKGGDYDWIVAQSFDTKFVLHMDTGTMTWDGVFWKTDCEFNADDKTCSVQPAPYDYYKAVLDGYEKEYDLVKLAPASAKVSMLKRQILQVYAMSDGVGDKVLTNFVGATSWEQDIQVSYSDVTHQKLVDDWKFTKVAEKEGFLIGGNNEDTYYYGMYLGDTSATIVAGGEPAVFENSRFRLKIWIEYVGGAQYNMLYTALFVTGVDAEVAGTRYSEQVNVSYMTVPETVHLMTDGSLPAVQTYSVLYARAISGESKGSSYSLLPSDDIIPQNLNYLWTTNVVTGQDSYIISDEVQYDPTPWGQNIFGDYFVSPGSDYAPVSRSLWSPLSIWVSKLHADAVSASVAAEAYTLKDAYPIEDAINVLLDQITGDSGKVVTFSNTDSLFLSGNSPLRTGRRVLISQLTNVKKTYYQNAAQTGKVTLKQIFDMLRDCFHCYWHIDSVGGLHIEHISWYMKGGTYSTDSRSPAVDMTEMNHPRNFKSWDFGQNVYGFDKVRLPERIELSFASSQTEPFNGLPIQYISGYVTKGNVERVSVSNFYSDVDWLISGASGTGDEGWVVLDAGYSSGAYSMSVVSVTIGGDGYNLQNGYMSFGYLEQQFFGYDMSAPDAEFSGGYAMTCHDTVKARTQTVEFPCTASLTDFDLIKTGIGVGEIDGIEYKIKSGSASADLKLPTEDE